jgi:hypothetical protein
MPLAFIASRTATSSSQVSGALPPAASRAALLIQTQLVEWTLTGAEIQLPSYLAKPCSAAGTTASQPSATATSLRLPSAPSAAQSWMSKPSICTAVGGSPAVTRARATLRTLAQATGLAATTISRALANDPRIAAQTRALVAEAALAHGYMPDRAAQRLRTGRTKVIQAC